MKRANRKNDDGTIDLAILTDGLKAEREQGITIDVAAILAMAFYD